MKAHEFAPALRILVRDITPDNDAPWYLLDFAHTEIQAQHKIISSGIAAQAATVETKIESNKSTVAQMERAAQRVNVDPTANYTPGEYYKDSHTGKLARVLAVNPPYPKTGNPRRGVLFQFADEQVFCPVASLDCYEKAAGPTKDAVQLAEDKQRTDAGELAAIEQTRRDNEALANASIGGFEVGDEISDKFTGARVFVSAINPPFPKTGNPRRGIAWKNPALAADAPDATGFVPEGSLGCYVKVESLGKAPTPAPAETLTPFPATPVAPIASEPTPAVNAEAAAQTPAPEPVTVTVAPAPVAAPAAIAAKPAAMRQPPVYRKIPAAPKPTAKPVARPRPATPPKHAAKKPDHPKR